MLLSGFIKYLAYERNYSPLTVSCYERDLKAFQQFFENARQGMEGRRLRNDTPVACRHAGKGQHGGHGEQTAQLAAHII